MWAAEACRRCCADSWFGIRSVSVWACVCESLRGYRSTLTCFMGKSMFSQRILTSSSCSLDTWPCLVPNFQNIIVEGKPRSSTKGRHRKLFSISFWKECSFNSNNNRNSICLIFIVTSFCFFGHFSKKTEFCLYLNSKSGKNIKI